MCGRLRLRPGKARVLEAAAWDAVVRDPDGLRRWHVRIHDLETPVVLIDLDLVEQNLRRFQTYCDLHALRNRPHIKTHKIPDLARRQVELGAVGIACQKLGEAEVMAEAGLDDILLPYNLLGPQKLARAAQLAGRIRLAVTADSSAVAEGLSTMAHDRGLEVPVLVECDTGMGRCGVQSPQAALALAQAIDRLPGLRFGGLMTYPAAHEMDRAAAFIDEALDLCRRAGLNVSVVSSGGTPDMWRAHEVRGVTEHRPGTYIYNDRYIVASGAAAIEDCAMRILVTVVSRPTPKRAIIDAGSKTLSSDLLGLEGYGYVCEYPDAEIYALNEEHGYVAVGREGPAPALGERLQIIPNHACVVSNLHDRVVGVRGDLVETTWTVSARGKVQ
jgi:D-serine deaminase-like pyridoxal phosphate-dependent protein